MKQGWDVRQNPTEGDFCSTLLGSFGDRAGQNFRVVLSRGQGSWGIDIPASVNSRLLLGLLLPAQTS